jgi:uncharacterized membrane protein
MISFLKKSSPYRYLTGILIFFGIIFSLISLVNHYNFRTYTLDLGLYTNALYKYSHFKLADNNMFKDSFEYILGGHFDLYLVLFSPLVYIFRTYTLLVIQILALLAGGVGVFKYFRFSYPEKPNLALFACLYLLLFYGVYSALSFDYHSIVVAAMLVPWLFLFIKQQKFGAAAIVSGLALISQENMALWLIFICLGLIIEFRKSKKTVIFLSSLLLVSFVYFASVLFIIIPKFSMHNAYGGFLYSVLGKTPFEAIKTLLLHPIDNFRILFVNHNNTPEADYVKAEMHLFVLLSGAFLLVLRPQFLLMLIPVYFQKLFHDNYAMWGVGGQYSIEFAPILALGIFTIIAEFRNKRLATILPFLVLFMETAVTIRLFDRTKMYINRAQIRLYKPEHYSSEVNAAAIHQELAKLPPNAKVSAQAPFTPHLALRENIFQFPLINDAEYIVLSPKLETYPLDQATFNFELNKQQTSGSWLIYFRNDDLLILKRKVN